MELTQEADEHKEEKQSPRAEQQAQHSKQSGVLPCRCRWLGWCRVGPAATPTAQRRCRRTGWEGGRNNTNCWSLTYDRTSRSAIHCAAAEHDGLIKKEK